MCYVFVRAVLSVYFSAWPQGVSFLSLGPILVWDVCGLVEDCFGAYCGKNGPQARRVSRAPHRPHRFIGFRLQGLVYRVHGLVSCGFRNPGALISELSICSAVFSCDLNPEPF